MSWLIICRPHRMGCVHVDMLRLVSILLLLSCSGSSSKAAARPWAADGSHTLSRCPHRDVLHFLREQNPPVEELKRHRNQQNFKAIFQKEIESGKDSRLQCFAARTEQSFSRITQVKPI